MLALIASTIVVWFFLISPSTQAMNSGLDILFHLYSTLSHISEKLFIILIASQAQSANMYSSSKIPSHQLSALSVTSFLHIYMIAFSFFLAAEDFSSHKRNLLSSILETTYSIHLEKILLFSGETQSMEAIVKGTKSLISETQVVCPWVLVAALSIREAGAEYHHISLIG